MTSRVHASIAVVAVLALVGASAGPPLFTQAFPPEEFAARRARVFEKIGDGVAILQGAGEYPAYVKFRQNNQFFYLSGIEVPRAMLVLDGRTKRTTLYLQPRDERLERSEGPVLTPGPDAERLTGIEAVRPRDEFAGMVAQLARAGRTLYIPHRAESLGAATPQNASLHAEKAANDPWEGRPSRNQAFLDRVKATAAGVAVKDLDPILDEMRMVKSPREIEAVRAATRIAGLAIMEAMRAARPGMYEYELEAIGDYFFKRHNARGPAYYGLVAAGKNAFYPHYHAAQSQLADGDLVLFDYAPDYQYYASDVTRMFPANGRWSTPQRELYTVYLRMYQALMTSIRPHEEPRIILAEAARKMERIVASFSFSNESHRAAARRFVETHQKISRHGLGHWIGMEVHDVTAPYERLKPGMMFTIEPALTIPEDRIYLRLEDAILITGTGYENLSEFVPTEPDAIEKVMAEPSLFNRQAMTGSAGTR